MTEVAASELQKAVESQHGGTATFVQSAPVLETHAGEIVWNGTVHVFDLKGSPSGTTCAYAWYYERPDGKRSFFALLHLPPITSPRDAVRAAIVAESRTSK